MARLPVHIWQGSAATPSGWSQASGLVLSGELDVVLGVVDGLGEGHCCPGADTVVERLGMNGGAEVIDCGVEIVPVHWGHVDGGAVEGDGRLGPTDLVEEDNEVTDRSDHRGVA